MTGEELYELINLYAENKKEQDAYKKLVERDNTKIKEEMEARNISEFTAGQYVAKKIVSETSKFDEERLLKYLHDNNITECIQTREIVNFDVLEDMIYHDKIDKDILAGMSACQTTKQTVSLRISKAKNKESEE